MANDPGLVETKEGSNSPQKEWRRWSQETKDREVDLSREEMTNFLVERRFSEKVVKAVQGRHDENAKLYKERIPGSAHDEYHMAKVRRWSQRIFKKHEAYIPEGRNKAVALALTLTAVDHDRGDVPQDNPSGRRGAFS